MPKLVTLEGDIQSALMRRFPPGWKFSVSKPLPARRSQSSPRPPLPFWAAARFPFLRGDEGEGIYDVVLSGDFEVEGDDGEFLCGRFTPDEIHFCPDAETAELNGWGSLFKGFKFKLPRNMMRMKIPKLGKIKLPKFKAKFNVPKLKLDPGKAIKNFSKGFESLYQGMGESASGLIQSATGAVGNVIGAATGGLSNLMPGMGQQAEEMPQTDEYGNPIDPATGMPVEQVQTDEYGNPVQSYPVDQGQVQTDEYGNPVQSYSEPSYQGAY